jgi:hypothetical protein
MSEQAPRPKKAAIPQPPGSSEVAPPIPWPWPSWPSKCSKPFVPVRASRKEFPRNYKNAQCRIIIAQTLHPRRQLTFNQSDTALRTRHGQAQTCSVERKNQYAHNYSINVNHWLPWLQHHKSQQRVINFDRPNYVLHQSAHDRP